MAKLIGTAPNQTPTNADLGDMAYKDGDNLQAGPLTINDGKVGVGASSLSDATLEIRPSSDIPQIKLTQSNVGDGGDGWKFHNSGPTGGNLAIIREASGTDFTRMTITTSGAVKPLTYQETYVAKSAASTVTCDLATGTSFSLTMAQNTTFAFTNPPSSGTAFSFTLFITQHSTAVTLTWPNTVDWAGGSAPDAAGNNEVQAYAFFTRDGGTTYYGFLGGTAIA